MTPYALEEAFAAVGWRGAGRAQGCQVVGEGRAQGCQVVEEGRAQGCQLLSQTHAGWPVENEWFGGLLKPEKRANVWETYRRSCQGQ